VTDATILVPTHRHAALLPYALRSALAQEGVELELFVVGDGVEDDTRAALEPFLADARVRFFDFPKGARHGEAHRHEALREATGRFVCYLSDDDLLLPDHAADMAALLEDADFAHSAPLVVLPGGALRYGPVDLERAEFHALLLRGGWNKVVLTGAAHTLGAYRRLPHGWRPAPPDVWTDLYMWQQFLRLPGFRGRTSARLTHLHLADGQRRDYSVEERVSELEDWWGRTQEPGFAEELAAEVAETVRRAAVVREARVHELKDALAAMRATRWWRLRAALATARPRGPRARRGEAR
jgi:GalNAc5-diNAcBac-PP-undecaprenol beta-1,3-glucosyltransferase